MTDFSDFKKKPMELPNPLVIDKTNPLKNFLSSIAGQAAAATITGAMQKSPKLFKALGQKMGLGGFERGELVGQAKAMEALVNTIKTASFFEMMAYLNQIINLNPTVKFTRDVIGVVGGSIFVYKVTTIGGSYILGKYTLVMFKTNCRDLIYTNFEKGLLSTEQYKIALQFIKETNSIEELEKLLMNRFKI